MTTHPHPNGNGHLAEPDGLDDFSHRLEEPVHLKGFSVAYDRKFNCGNFESVALAITIWVKSQVDEGESFDLHHARERVRRMARENVRAQWQRFRGKEEVVFLGLQPPLDGQPDPIFVRTVSVSLVQKVNQGDYNSITPGFTDWADVRHVAHSPGELHIALARMWQSLWANVADEIARAQGQGATGAFLGLPKIEVEDLTAAPAAQSDRRSEPVAQRSNGRQPAANGSRR